MITDGDIVRIHAWTKKKYQMQVSVFSFTYNTIKLNKGIERAISSNPACKIGDV